MSILIDDLTKQHQNSSREIDGAWYRCKDIPYWAWNNVIDAFRVLIGKSRAYHFKEDETKRRER
jgi:hypothetical protein